MNTAPLELLADRYYAKLRMDGSPGTVFNSAVADWPEHLEKLSAFWSSVMLISVRHKGSPMAASSRFESRGSVAA